MVFTRVSLKNNIFLKAFMSNESLVYGDTDMYSSAYPVHTKPLDNCNETKVDPITPTLTTAFPEWSKAFEGGFKVGEIAVFAARTKRLPITSTGEFFTLSQRYGKKIKLP